MRKFIGAPSTGLSKPSTNADASIIDAIAIWCECLSGRLPLKEALSKLVNSVGGSAILISRIRKDLGGIGRSIIFDQDEKYTQGNRLTRSYAECVLGTYFAKSKCGTIWYSSMLDETVDPAMHEFQMKRNFRELTIIPIESGDKYTDFLEIHFQQRLNADQLAKLNMITAALVGAWSRRTNGLFSDAYLSHLPKNTSSESGAPILSPENPARLSRCEYRLCLLLSHGLSLLAAEVELGVSRATIRTHLRSIYFKTSCKSRSELTYKLLSRGRSIQSRAGLSSIRA